MKPSTERHDLLYVVPRLGGTLAVLLLFAGCQTYESQTQGFAQASQLGDLGTAIAQVEKQVKEKAGSKDELIHRFEQGAIFRTAALADPSMVPDIRPPLRPPKKGELPPEPLPEPTPEEIVRHYAARSIAALDIAEQLVDKWDEQSKVIVSAEAGALVTNQASLPYRGRAYDKIMMNTYKALNYVAISDWDKARVELNRSLQRQRDAVDLNERRIAEAQREAELARKGELKDEKGKSASYDSTLALADPRTGPALQSILEESTSRIRPYGDYVNPFSVFLDGLFFTVLGEDGSDLERGRKSFERVAGMVPENSFLARDLEASTKAAEGIPPQGVTYVIFETGSAPSRSQIRIDIPTFLVTRNLAYVGAAFPKLVFHENYHRNLTISCAESTFETETIAEMDSVVANDFRNEWPTIVTKTLVSTATKAIIQASIQKELNDQGGWAGVIGAVVMTAVNSATNIADTRTWQTLPKEFQYARIPTPPNREISLSVANQERTVNLGDGSVNLVYVKSASETSPLFVRSTVLK